MSGQVLVDVAGRRRSPATVPGYHAGRPPRNKGLRYPADPPRIEEIIAVMRQAGTGILRLDRVRALIVVLWRSGLRVSEALALGEADLGRAPRVGAGAVRQGRQASRGRDGRLGVGATGGPGSTHAVDLPVGRLFCVIDGPTRGRPWAPGAVRTQLRRLAAQAGVRRRFAPHQLRHAHAVEMAREGVPLNVIQRQLGHTDLGVTSVYLQGIDNAEIINTIHARTPPMMPASAGLRL